MTDIFAKFEGLSRAASHLMTAAPRNPFDVVIERPLSATIGLIEGRETLLFGTNNYLGLSQCPEAISAAVKTLKEEGVGTTGSRIANGTYGLHRQLEKKLAAFFGRRHCIIFSTGYQANLGCISALAGKDDILFIDADSHASIYDGSRLGNAQVIRFRHNDPADLDKRLNRVKNHHGAKLIVIEGVYSMTGNVAPVRAFAEVKKKHGAWLLVDEAHSFGVLGENGRGVAEQDGCEEDIDFVVGTFSKSLGTIGGYCVSNHDGVEMIRLASRPYMFTASLPPDIIAASAAALEVLQAQPHLRTQLTQNAGQLHAGLKKLGLSVSQHVSPVVAVTLPDIPTAAGFWNRLLELGVYVNLSLPPATPDERPLLRCSVMAAHSPAQIDTALAAFAKAAQDLGVLTA